MAPLVTKNFLALSLLLSLGVSPALAAAPGNSSFTSIFGGDSSDGAISLSGSVASSRQYNATTLTVNSAAVVTFNSGTEWKAQRAVTISGAVNSINDIPNEGGPSRGLCMFFAKGAASANRGAGAGAGCGGSGADLGIGGGYALPINLAASGSGGGMGDFLLTNGSDGPVLAGGTGGGKLTICSIGTLSITSSGSLTSNGGSAPNNSTTGHVCGGGGSGGVFALYSLVHVTNSGTISATGGNGGTTTTSGSGYTGGGGGGGGIILMESPTAPTAGTTVLTGGTSGTNGPSSNGGAGVLITITDMPSLPLICLNDNHINSLAAVAVLRGGRLEMQRENHISFLASLEAIRNGDSFKSEVARLNQVSEGEICDQAALDNHS